MATESSQDSRLARWYRNRIGIPTTSDEVIGYWIFTLGFILGFLGIGLLLQSSPASGLRQWAVVLAAGGLVMLLVGPIIRLPLERNATYLSYIGVAIAAGSIIWFLVSFPSGWDPRSGNAQIIGLYSLGLVVIAVGGLFVPLLRPTSTDSPSPTSAPAAASQDTELAEKNDAIADLETEIRRVQTELDDIRESKARFQLYEDSAGEWRWHLRHRNGNIIADSGEGYTARHNAIKGLESVRRNALGAETLQEEREDAAPAEEVSFEPFEEVASRADFEIYQDNAGEWRWRLEHDNGNILADSGEGYASQGNVTRAIDSIRRNVPVANYLEIDPTAFELYEDVDGEWRWRLLHRNGNILADSGEGYASRRNARNAITTVKELEGVSFEVYEDDAGEYRWRLEHQNGNIMADSGEGYSSESGAEDAVERVNGYVPDAKVADVGPSSFEVYQAADDEWRWRLRHRNGNILADSGEGYTTRRDAIRGIGSVKRNTPGADVE